MSNFWPTTPAWNGAWVTPPPQATALRGFLERFHDAELETLRPPRAEQKRFMLPAGGPQPGLQAVRAGVVRSIARRYEAQGAGQHIATVDQDATIIGSHQQAARAHYDDGRGHQPIVALWAEADLVLAEEYRDGNVPAKQAPLACAQRAFAALPAGIRQRFFRGDSACHEHELLGWLKDPARAAEPGGAIGFAISAVMSGELKAEVAQVAESAWRTFATEADGTLRQWAEVPFGPGEKPEGKGRQPLRYVGLRRRKARGELFADGTDRRHHAVITNLTPAQMAGDQLLNWQRAKAGTVEHRHDEVKNELGGDHVPSRRFGVNAAWFTLGLLTYNVVSAVKGLCFNPEERAMRLKQFRVQVINLAGRMNRNNCVMGLRLCAAPEAIARLKRIWEVFDLPTQATAAQALGKGEG